MIQRIQFSKECSKCKMLIKGNSESQVEYNLKVHLRQKHKGVKKK